MSALVFNAKSSWPIKYVTVYRDRAQVIRVEPFTPTSADEVSFEVHDLSVNIKDDSVRIDVESGEGQIMEFSVVNNTVHSPESKKLSSELQELQGKLAEVQRKINVARVNLQTSSDVGKSLFTSNVVNNELKTAESLKTILSDSSSSAFEGYLNSFKTSYAEESFVIITLEGEADSINKEIDAVRAKILNSTVVKKQVKGCVKFNESVVGKEMHIRLSYTVMQALWTPSYNATLVRDENIVNIDYMGSIVNNTSEDWINVVLALSTATPSTAGAPPKLKGVGLKAVKPEDMYFGGGGMDEDDASEFNDRASLFYGELDAMPQNEIEIEDFVMAERSTVESKGGMALFKLSELTTVETDGKEHKQKVTSFSLTPKLSCYAAPKVSQYCFLQATTRNTSSYHLLAGKLSVFYGERFVATTSMEMVSKGQEFTFSLGVDESLKLEISPEKSSEKVIKGSMFPGAKSYTVRTIERNCRIINTRGENIRCLLEEQVPLSDLETIKVEVLEPSDKKMKSKPDKYKITASSHLRVSQVVKKNASKDFKLKYSMKWPANQKIRLMNQAV